MNYTQLTEKKKVKIDILLKQGLSMREVARRLNISHSTISRYKSGYYKKRKVDIEKKFEIFIKFLLDHYDRKTSSIEICVNKFKKSYFERCPSVKSITVDNGLEFKALGLTAKKLKVKLYKCDPYCSFQRGTNERMNGLVRRFLPKGISLKNVTQQELERIAFEINFMPKKIFDFKTSFEIKSKYK